MEGAPKNFKHLEALLKENNGGDGYFVGDEVMYLRNALGYLFSFHHICFCMISSEDAFVINYHIFFRPLYCLCMTIPKVLNELAICLG